MKWCGWFLLFIGTLDNKKYRGSLRLWRMNPYNKLTNFKLQTIFQQAGGGPPLKR